MSIREPFIREAEQLEKVVEAIEAVNRSVQSDIDTAKATGLKPKPEDIALVRLLAQKHAEKNQDVKTVYTAGLTPQEAERWWRTRQL